MVAEIYKITRDILEEELYELINQLRRSIVSIPSNIAEGVVRNHGKDFIHYLYILPGCDMELDAQLRIARNLHFLSAYVFHEIKEQNFSKGKM